MDSQFRSRREVRDQSKQIVPPMPRSISWHHHHWACGYALVWPLEIAAPQVKRGAFENMQRGRAADISCEVSQTNRIDPNLKNKIFLTGFFRVICLTS